MRTGILAAVAWAGAGIVNAHANTLTLDVSATLIPVGLSASCSGSGCTLGGDIVVNDGTGAIISEDVTARGFSPKVTPFTRNSRVVTLLGRTVIVIDDSTGRALFLDLSTPTAGSLVGYRGGSLAPGTSIERGRAARDAFDETTDVDLSRFAAWKLESGSLTDPAPAPEPPSVVLLAFVLAAACALLGRHFLFN